MSDKTQTTRDHMTRTVHPHEILVSICIFAVIVAGVFGGGYWTGHRGMDDLRRSYEVTRDGWISEVSRESALGYLFDQEDAIHINAQCRGDASDWTTIRISNEIGRERDVPVFIHGNCLTHSVVTAKPVGPALREYDCTDCRTIDQPNGCICDHGEALPDGQ